MPEQLGRAQLAAMDLTAGEIASQKLAPETLAKAIQLVDDQGYVVLTSVMSRSWCRKMSTAWARYDAGENSDPWSEDIMDPLAVENPWALQIMEAIMPDMWAQLPYWTNVTTPGQTYGQDWRAPGDPTTQAVHRDQPHLFPETDLILPPHALIQHITLCDFTDDNGSTELWPTTHKLVDTAENDMGGGYATTRWKGAEERAASVPAVSMNCPAGSIMVRDMRMWRAFRINSFCRFASSQPCNCRS